MKKRDFGIVAILLLIAGGMFVRDFVQQSGPSPWAEPTPVVPDWASISAWPDLEQAEVTAQPDPNRRITTIVLDDSGSMGGDMEPAKEAVVQALDAMAPTDRVSVLSLHQGVILPFQDVADARDPLRNALQYVRSDGRTPLTPAVIAARSLLEQEAAQARGFGTYRMIVTTDGAADNPETLIDQVEALARNTPIQLATIGIGITGDHVLRRESIGTFVDVSNVDALKEALQAAIAENTDFTAITAFEGDG